MISIPTSKVTFTDHAGHHKGIIDYEKNNFELAKQDRQERDKNLFLSESDLSTLMSRKGD